MGTMWMLYLLAVACSRLGYGLPLGSPPHSYPQDEATGGVSGWNTGNSWLLAVPALALVLAAASMLFGCLWCYRHKDCKLFASSSSQLQDVRRNQQQPANSGFSEPVNNNPNEDNNNGPISLREMQNIANNNAVAYIVSENEERNRAASRESVVEFEPLPVVVGPLLDPLEGCADWFGDEDFPRDRLQYLREIGRGWFGRVVEGEVETAEGSQSPVAVKILSQNASLEDKARFLREARPYRELRHENILAYVASCLLEDPFILIFELCPMTLQQYLIANRSKMAALTDAGVPLRLVCDVTSALSHMHGRGLYYGDVVASNVLVRGEGDAARCVLGRYIDSRDISPHETVNASTDVCSLGVLLWEVSSWGEQPAQPPLAEPTLPTPYRAHMYQVMQLCWNPNQENRPTSTQVHALVSHLYATHLRLTESPQDDGYSSCDFEDRWQRLKPNHIPVVDEHIAIIHAPSTSMVSHFTNSEEFASQTLSVDMDTAVSRSSSIMSDNLLSVQAKSESLNNLHGSYEDVRNNYLSSNGQSECKQSNVSDASVDPWLKDIIAGSQDDVSYYRDVSDVIKNLDNILNSEKTSSSESSHQASPSRDNLSLDCKREVAAPSSLVKSPGIRNFQNILEMGAEEVELEDEVDRDTIGTLSHSFERHSDTTSQNTLANLTPDTPSKDLNLDEEKVPDEIPVPIVQQDMPNNVIENSCRLKSTNVDVGSVSVFEQSELSEDCQFTCEIIGAESAPAKSIDETLRELDMKFVDNPISHCLTSVEIDNLEINRNIIHATTDFLDNEITLNRIHDIERQKQNNTDVVLNNVFVEESKPVDIENFNSNAGETTEDIIEVVDLKQQPDSITDITSLPEFTESKVTENSGVNDRDELAEDIKHTSDEKDISEIKFASEELVNNVIESALDALSSEIIQTNQFADEESTFHDFKEVTYQNITQGYESLSQAETLPVENCNKNQMKLDDADVTISESFGEQSLDTASTLPIGNIPDLVQNVDVIATKHRDNGVKDDSIKSTINDSTIYMDLINASGSVIRKDETLDNNIRQVIKTCVSETNTTADNDYTLVRNESTVYLDLPSNLINDTHEFLHVEKLAAECDLKDGNLNESFPTSTPNANEANGKITTKSIDSGRCTPDLGPGVTLTKLEFKSVPENLSPLDSPSKSHPTDTYDENSSVLLGPFENCSLELFKPVKSMPDLQLPREELLAFSSNFSDINLETPSPLRDVNFLNEVPDILSEDSKFEVKSVSLSEKEEAKHDDSVPKAGPSTPPNSPGNFQDNAHKYAPEVDVTSESSSRPLNYSLDYDNEIELNQIELQLTSKLAMAENENNMNIEYSGPLTVEGLVRDDFVQEAYLAGNGQEAVIQEPRPVFALDENCMAALRNELELKLPLAQVASIEPAEDDPVQVEEEEIEVGFCAPELIVNYAGVLSPIAEETGRQLSAYDNDLMWTASNATDSSESYLEPCNNSTDEVTDLPTGLQSGLLEHSTYTVEEPKSPRHDTYTLNKDSSSKEGTMSTDSLNVVVPDIGADGPKSPIDDQTYNKHDEKDRISQISPFLVSPTTDTSTPYTENVTGISTLSKATVPTDAKALKQCESQNLSKATSIDSWCSNDTLFNVEDNFDDLAPEGEAENDKSDDSDTLNDENQFNDSTYNVPDDKSPDSCSQDSLTANCTYTKLKTEDKTSPIVVTSSDNIESSPKDTQTRDLAYGTLMSGLASYSSCTNDLMSANDELWRLPQPELVRRSPLYDDTVNLTPPSNNDLHESKNELKPKLNHEPSIKKLDSIDVSCFDDVHEDSNRTQPSANVTDKRDSPGYHYKHMAQSIHSTPLTELICDESAENTEVQPENLQESQQSLVLAQIPNFQNFVNSAELRPQERSLINLTCTNAGTEELLEGESNSAIVPSDQMLSYASFEASADDRPQEVNSKSSQSINSDDFRNFESSVQERPQDLSSIIESSAFLLKSECKLSEIAASMPETSLSMDNTDGNLVIDEGRVTNLEDESQLNLDSLHYVTPVAMPFIEETEQPHSIIMTIDNNEISQINEVNKTYDSHETHNIVNDLYDSHRKEIVNGDVARNNGTRDAVKLPELVETVNFALQSTVTNGFNIPSSDKKENYATLSFLSQPYEEIRGNDKSKNVELSTKSSQEREIIMNNQGNGDHIVRKNGNGEVVGKVANVTEDFLSNEKNYSGFLSYDALLSDIRFSGPSSEIMSTSFCGESPSEPTAPPVSEIEKLNGTVENILKEWDSDSEDSPSSNSSSCEFLWKDGDGHERSLVSTTMFQHQHKKYATDDHTYRPHRYSTNKSSRWKSKGSSSADSESGSEGVEGEEVAFEPSSWDSKKAPAKSSLRSLESVPSFSDEGKKKVVFKEEKYHSVYEYPREVYDPELNKVAKPDDGPYSEWTTNSEDPGTETVPVGTETAPVGTETVPVSNDQPLDKNKLHTGVVLNAPYEDDFYISSSAPTLESLGLTSSEFFPGKHLKSHLIEHADQTEDYPPPPSPLCPAPDLPTRSPSADFFTPDSGVEDITPVSTSIEEDFKKKLEDPTQTQCWKTDSPSSSESVSPSSPGGEALGGLRHTRDKLKLDLPPSPHIPSPRHNRVFNFVLDKPKRRHPNDETERPQTSTTPLIMTDDTPLVINTIPVEIENTPAAAEPTFSTFGKEPEKTEDGENKVVLEEEEVKKVVLKKEEEKKVVLTEEEVKKVVLKKDGEEEEEEGVKTEATNDVKVKTVKGEGTVSDSGDEDSGIESSAKTSLERNKTPNVS